MITFSLSGHYSRNDFFFHYVLIIKYATEPNTVKEIRPVSEEKSELYSFTVT